MPNSLRRLARISFNLPLNVDSEDVLHQTDNELIEQRERCDACPGKAAAATSSRELSHTDR